MAAEAVGAAAVMALERTRPDNTQWVVSRMSDPWLRKFRTQQVSSDG